MIDYLMPEARAWKNKDPAQEGGTRGRRVLQISRHFAGDGIAEQHVSKVERKLRVFGLPSMQVCFCLPAQPHLSFRCCRVRRIAA